MQIRNYSPKTINAYVCSLINLARYYNLSPEAISKEQFKVYLHYLTETKKVSFTTINQLISALKILQHDVLGNDWEQVRVKRPRSEKKLPVVLSKDEVEKLIQTTENIKHKVIIALAYSSGLRKEEVQTLKPSDIDSKRMTIHVRQGKGKKDRYTILANKTLDLLRIYYRIIKPVNFLFESSMRKGNMLSDNTLLNIVKNNAKKADIKKEVSFHTLRHTFATHMLEQGTNLRLIQSFMGHNSLKTTSIYLHVAQIDPKTILSPLDDMDI